MRLPDGAGEDLKAAASGVERSLIEALARHAPFHVISRSEMVAVAGQAMQNQLMGCDAEGCMAEIADVVIAIDSTHYGRVEDAEMGILHMLCYAFIENPQWGRV